MMSQLVPSEIGTMGAGAVRELTSRAVGGAGVAEYVEADPMPWSVIADGGWDLLGAPESEGGGGASTVDLTVLAREWGRACLPLPFVSSLLARRWSSAAREHEGPVGLSVGARGAGRVCFGRSESIAVLRGHEVVSPPDGEADAWVPSLRPVRAPWVTELTGDQRAELSFVLAAEATGVAERTLEIAVEYARGREQFGTPIGSFQAVKHRLSTMAVRAESAETAVLWAATEPVDAARAAAWALSTSQSIVEDAIQVHGGMGFTWELGMHYYLRHVVTLSELQRSVTS